MTLLLAVIAVMAIVIGLVITLIGYRLVRGSHERQAERIQALQALASAPRREPVLERVDALPIAVEIERSAPVASQFRPEAEWDLSFRPPSPSASAGQAPEVRTSKFELRSSESPTLFEETVPRSGRRWSLIGAAVLIIASGIGVFYVLSSGIIGRVTASTARSAEPAAVTVAAPLELLSLRHSAAAADAFVVTGLVQNPAAGGTLRGVYAMVYLFDAEGRYFASSRSALDAATLSAGGQSAFTVRVPATASVTRYRVSFQLEDGAAVIHVDRRGTLPEGTTGDAITMPDKAPGKRKAP